MYRHGNKEQKQMNGFEPSRKNTALPQKKDLKYLSYHMPDVRYDDVVVVSSVLYILITKKRRRRQFSV